MKVKSLQEFLFLHRIPISFYLWYFTGDFEEVKRKINPVHISSLGNRRLIEQLGIAIETKNNSVIEILFYIFKKPEHWIDLILWTYNNEKHPWLNQDKWVKLHEAWWDYIRDIPTEYIKVFNPKANILNKKQIKIKRRKL